MAVAKKPILTKTATLDILHDNKNATFSVASLTTECRVLYCYADSHGTLHTTWK